MVVVAGVTRVGSVVDVRVDNVSPDLVPVELRVACLLVLYLVVNALTVLHGGRRVHTDQTKSGDTGHCLECVPNG